MTANRRDATDAEIDAYFFKNDVVPKLRAGGLDARFCHEITEWKCPQQERVFNLCQEKLINNGAIIALVGPRGTGKTTIAAQIMIRRIRAFYAYYGVAPEHRKEVPRGNGRYFKLADLIRDLKPLYADFGSINTDELVRRQDIICKTALVMIDEVHECGDRAMGDRVSTDLIDRRYSALTDTIIISNQSTDEFKKTTNDSILSRLSEHGAIIKCEWDSHRAKK